MIKSKFRLVQLCAQLPDEDVEKVVNYFKLIGLWKEIKNIDNSPETRKDELLVSEE